MYEWYKITGAYFIMNSLQEYEKATYISYYIYNF